MPSRASCIPFWTVSRPQPKRRSAWRGLPAHSGGVTSGGALAGGGLLAGRGRRGVVPLLLQPGGVRRGPVRERADRPPRRAAGPALGGGLRGGGRSGPAGGPAEGALRLVRGAPRPRPPRAPARPFGRDSWLTAAHGG